jgi:nicotinamide riboside kinase
MFLAQFCIKLRQLQCDRESYKAANNVFLFILRAPGDVSSGKSTLLAKLQGQSETDSHKSVSLEYTYIELFADDAEGT